MLAVLLVLQACAPTSDSKALPGDCGTGFARDDDGDCVAIAAEDTSALEDADADGFRPFDGDCDDADARVNPGTVEVCDGLDNNCSGAIDEGVLLTVYLDKDEDGFGIDSETDEVCRVGRGWALVPGDCDDLAPSTSPTDPDDTDDGIDNDCDGLVDEDFGACAAAYGSVAFAVSSEQSYSAEGTSSFGPLEGYGTICGFSCDVNWLYAAWIADGRDILTPLGFPLSFDSAAGDAIYPLVTVRDANENVTGTCTAHTSAGDVWDPLESTCRHASLSIL